MSLVHGCAAVAAAAFVSIPALAGAQLDSDQKKCVTSLQKAGAKVAGAVAKEFSACVKNAGKGKLGGLTATACLTADPKGKVGKAKVKTAGVITKSCGVLPTFGPDDATEVNDAMSDDILQVEAAFGFDFDAAIISAANDKAGAGCQATVAKDIGKLFATKHKTYNACVSGGLKSDAITDASGMEACFGLDPKGKVAKAAAKFGDSVAKKCGTTTVADAFPGAGTGDALGTLAADYVELIDCGLCLALNAAEGLALDCDTLDDGLANLSCSDVGPTPEFPDTPAEYTAGITSYVNSLTIPAVVDGVPTCCEDFGPISKDFIASGTDNIDNALAQLAVLLGSLASLQDLLDEGLADGSVVLIADHQTLNEFALPDPFALAIVNGSFDNGTDFAQASAGNGEFLIETDAFLGGTGEPASLFFPSLMTETDMTAGPASLDFPIPFGILTLDLTVSAAKVTGVHSGVDAAGIEYTSGTISGYLQIDQFFSAANAILNGDDCSCLGLTEDVYQKIGGFWTGVCVTDPELLCTLPDEEICATLAGNSIGEAQVCGALPFFIADAADIDLTADPGFEGLSLGIEFTAVPGQVNGVNVR